MPPSIHPIHPIPSHPIPDPDSTDLGRKSNQRHTSSPRLPLRPCHFSLWCPCLDSRVATLCALFCLSTFSSASRTSPHLHLQTVYLLSALVSSCCLDEHSELANSKPRKASKQTDLRASRIEPAGRTLSCSHSHSLQSPRAKPASQVSQCQCYGSRPWPGSLASPLRTPPSPTGISAPDLTAVLVGV